MLTKSKKHKLLLKLKEYQKMYFNNKITDLDESGTRLMINFFLTDVLGFTPIEEVKTEYMIRGTYADYVVQKKGVRHFLVEVKSLSLELSDKHLRQAINYGANEGIEWALLTNGKNFELYKILFNKPIESKKIFTIDLSSQELIKDNVEILQYLHTESVAKKGLDLLWAKHVALDPASVASLLYAPPIINFIRRALKKKYKNNVSPEEVTTSINQIICEAIQLDNVKHIKFRKERKKKNGNNDEKNVNIQIPCQPPSIE
ncbi:type I restriction enzyme HsdR N-terminal domain-containing protein [Candidatus Peregrinibacteria bacterium]|nr:type I restriction enzyme HsdR N-terminal domain-containing protein [Candidatus Peregrinibacteria bacterium]